MAPDASIGMTYRMVHVGPGSQDQNWVTEAIPPNVETALAHGLDIISERAIASTATRRRSGGPSPRPAPSTPSPVASPAMSASAAA